MADDALIYPLIIFHKLQDDDYSAFKAFACTLEKFDFLIPILVPLLDTLVANQFLFRQQVVHMTIQVIINGRCGIASPLQKYKGQLSLQYFRKQQTGLKNKTVMDKVENEILTKIARIYDKYEEQANQKSEDKRKKMGAQIDKQQKQFLQQLNRIQTNITNLLKEIEKSPHNKDQNVRDSQKTINQLLKDLQSITKKKNLMFKVNQHLLILAQRTNEELQLIRKQLPAVGDTGFCCGGGDGPKKFKQTTKRFSATASQWKMMAYLQPKDSVENFVSPKFDQSEFGFIRKILKDSWPKPQEPTVVQKVREVVKEVPKNVYVGGQTKCSLANEYIYGINRQQNPSFGLKIYHEEAEKNDSAACSFLGQVYEEGLLLPKNMTKAMKYYQSGNKAYGKYRFAMALIRGKLNQNGVNKADLEKGHKLLSQLSSEKSEQPCPQALVQLGSLYEKGKFEWDHNDLHKVNIDLKEAIACYKKARSLHLPRASNNLGVLYFNNKFLAEGNPNSKLTTESNVQDNLQKAKKYLEEAEEQGFHRACFNLGCIYEKGLIGKKDPEKALKYFYRGGLMGDLPSKLKFAYQLMKQTSILKEEYEDHYQIAHKWLEGIILKFQLEEFQHDQEQKKLQKAEAMFYLGLMYEFGFGVEKSPKRAFNYFLQSSDLEYPAAKNKIGDCYFSGYGVKEDRQMAIGCYLQAADLNNSDAMVNLGTIYLNGIPNLVERNYTKAYDNFVKSMDLDNSDAMIHLSYMYKNGLGFDSDQEMSKKLLEQSAKNKNSTALYMLKEMGGQFDERILFDNLENEFFSAPKKINLKEILPLISHITNK